MKKIEGNKKAIFATLATIGLMTFADTASAITIGDMARNITQNTLGGVNTLLTGGAYLLGIAFGVKAILKLKEHNESEGRVKLSTAITLGVVSACLIALPTFLKSGVETTLGSGATMGSINGTTIQ